MENKKKSPLTDSPLRNPGQSLDEEIDKILDEEGLIYLILPIFSIVLAGLEWWRWYSNISYSPITFTIIAISTYA